ncbi:unnamed protein product, partial [Vitis vinifera]|uniref:Gnk2-homologous domain-containing protein n=1 Tax=Vitis vinifera TaxID=29760 RepID=E0CW20_VITVI
MELFFFQRRRQKVTSYGLKSRSNGIFVTTLSCLLHLSIGAIYERVTIMDPPRLLLFLYPFLILHLLGVTVLAQTDFLYHDCSDSVGNYTDNSTYEANLNTLLSSLSSNNEIDYGFYNFSYGQNSDKVNAIALCRGDVVTDACRSCVNDSRIQLTQLCPNQKEAIGWYDKCMLRYSNNSIFGTAQTSLSFYMWNPENASNVEDFNQVLGNLMASLRSKAASGDSRHKFATGEANVTSFVTIYGLMQCTPDLSEASCRDCLEGATNEIPNCCDSKKGGRVIKPSCNLRFETYRFYEFTAANAPPPAATPPPSPPSADLAPPPLANTTSTQGKKSNTSRTVVLIVVPSAVISVMLITFICCFLKRRQSRESVSSKLNMHYLLLTLLLAIEIIIISKNDKRQLFSNNNLKIKALLLFSARMMGRLIY